MTIHQINGIKVRTNFARAPLPIRGLDWSAVNDRTYDGSESDPIGRGATELEAIVNLLEQIEERAQ